jgi:hypothetical protein
LGLEHIILSPLWVRIVSIGGFHPLSWASITMPSTTRESVHAQRTRSPVRGQTGLHAGPRGGGARASVTSLSHFLLGFFRRALCLATTTSCPHGRTVPVRVP